MISYTLLLLFLGSLMLHATYRTAFHPLADVPGPKLAKITGLWRSWQFLSGKWHATVLDLHKEYGRVVRIAPNELSIVDLSTNHKVYGRGATGKKSSWYNVWVTNPAAPGMFATQDEKQHAFLRRRVTKAYSMTTILASEAGIRSCLDDLVQKLEDYADDGKTIDMSFWTTALAFDIVCKLTLGAPLGMILSATDVMGLAENIRQVFTVISNLGYVPGQSGILHNRVVMALTSWLGVPNPMMKFQAWSAARIQKRIDSQETGDDDMLAHFLAMKDDAESDNLLGDVLTEVMIAVGAGADTVASAMRSCLLYICSNPKTNQQVQIEIDGLEDAAMTYSKVQQLPYLHAACQEAMRLSPPIVFPLPRCTETDLEVEGYHIPAGTVIATSAGAQNRDAAVFGPDADIFQPQRWLDNKGLAQKVMTFGGDGPTNCIGQNVAMVEIHLFVAYIFRNFEVALCDPARPWTVTSYWIAYQQQMKVRLTRRSQQQSQQAQNKLPRFGS